jgi:N-acyl-D-aspartate/D-glutamate deacylase
VIRNALVYDGTGAAPTADSRCGGSHRVTTCIVGNCVFGAAPWRAAAALARDEAHARSRPGRVLRRAA